MNIFIVCDSHKIRLITTYLHADYDTSSYGMVNRIDSRMSQSGTDRRVQFRWEEVVEAVLGMADMFKECFLGIMKT